MLSIQATFKNTTAKTGNLDPLPRTKFHGNPHSRSGVVSRVHTDRRRNFERQSAWLQTRLKRIILTHWFFAIIFTCILKCTLKSEMTIPLKVLRYKVKHSECECSYSMHQHPTTCAAVAEEYGGAAALIKFSVVRGFTKQIT